MPGPGTLYSAKAGQTLYGFRVYISLVSELLFELTIFKGGDCLADEDCQFLRCIIIKCQFPQTI